MTAVFAGLVMYGEISFAQVPASQKDKVREHLAALGLDENGKPITAE
ncbi:hypothetical protein E6C60_2565 [Paenibacillus algicola]|uniref:Uncharacterized protein n=1 Tax=Paenibacillus algicola TaxID=2565926 RepID=A0A4P8XKM3_9BACL|nr:hypothetical protein [Paenibacillus algicola]QCT03277.1 hypothetical protein E6C60_2565 [Paenibacillus algicola]